MDVSKYLELYLSESREHVSRMRERLPAEGAPDEGAVNELFRSAHSLKGMAASMGFDATSRLAHQLEALLARWRSGHPPEEDQQRAAVRAMDTLDALLDQVQRSSSDQGLEASVEGVIAALSGVSLRDEAGRAGAEAPAAVEAPLEAGAPGAGPCAVLTVAIDTASPLPAARLMVVAERVRAACPDAVMDPDLDTVRTRNLRTASFRVAATKGLKELALALRELPEISDVLLESEALPARQAPDAERLIRSMRVSADDLDALLAQTSELLYHLNLLEVDLRTEGNLRHHFWLEANRAKLNRLFDQVLSVRLVSFEGLAERLGRAARDLSDRLGKPVRFEAAGTDQRADRSLVERLLDPLMHLVRNALDHGLETPQERGRARKPPEGELRLEVVRDSEALLVSLSDDGRGIDIEGIRLAAVERGLFSAHEASQLDQARLFELLTLPAFSTKREVTDVSGRGVGLDVVRASVESLGGHLEMESQPGRGSRFTLVIPSATTLTRVLVFGWEDGVRYAMPTSQIRHIYPLSGTPLVWSGSRRHLQAGDDFVPVLSWRPGPVGREGFGLRIMAPGRDRVLLVSHVYQAERVVVLPLGPPLEMVPEWIGGALLATGEVAYVLDGRVLAKRDGEEAHVSQD